MALNIKNPEAERLAAELAGLTGESKTGAILVALRERLHRVRRERAETRDQRDTRLQRSLEQIWDQIPPEVRGRSISKDEREAILGLGPEGV
ncbi:MAG TPA: type II toxin-antitoxin system VapB family antitoxin [Gaiellaceae bacterium]|nr:type II toxin-antitoxin system VapB family antitoxin [Gaiellaceae bacterium]